MRHFVRITIAVLIVIVAVVASGIQPAQASLWQFSDGFDSLTADNHTFDTWGPWSCWHTASSGTCSKIKGDPFIGLPQTSPNYVYFLLRHTAQSNLVFVGRNISISPFISGRTLTCVAQMYVRPQTAVRGQLEVIDVATWTYVAVKPFTYSGFGGWSAVTTATWIPPRKDIHLRIGLFSNTSTDSLADVDSAIVQCGY